MFMEPLLVLYLDNSLCLHVTTLTSTLLQYCLPIFSFFLFMEKKDIVSWMGCKWNGHGSDLHSVSLNVNMNNKNIQLLFDTYIIYNK